MKTNSVDALPSNFFLSLGRNWRTIEVSIDFVDYILAKNFLGVVEEWFKSLEKIPENRVANYISRNSHLMIVGTAQTGRVGAACFLITYYFSVEDTRITLPNILLPAALCLLAWSIVQAVSTQIIESVRRKAAQNILPSCILLSTGDELAFSSANAGKTSTLTMAGQVIGGAIFAVALNIIASYIFAWMQ